MNSHTVSYSTIALHSPLSAQAHTLILEWGGGGSCSQKMDHNGAGDLYTLKLIDNQQHTQHEFHQAKLKLSTEWIPDWQFKSTRMKLSQYTLSRSANVS